MKGKINNRERELWILNDESFYSAWKSSKLSMRNFIKTYKTEIDEVINAVINRKPTESIDRYYKNKESK